MTMPKGWKPPEHDHTVSKYRNPIPPGYMPSCPPPSNISLPSSNSSKRVKQANRNKSIIAVVLLFVFIIFVLAVVLNPWILTLIPPALLGTTKGMKRANQMNRHIYRTSKPRLIFFQFIEVDASFISKYNLVAL